MVGPWINLRDPHLHRSNAFTGSSHSGQSFPDTPLGEALALRWADVDRQHASINVSHTLERIPGKPWRIVEPKSASGRRVVPLIGPAADSLHAQRKRVAEIRLAAREWADHDLVFPNTTRTSGVVVRGDDPLDGGNVYHELRKLLAKAGLPPARVHDLRHGTATYLLAAGVDPRVVMQMMGWSQVSMLKRYPACARQHAHRRRRAP